MPCSATSTTTGRSWTSTACCGPGAELIGLYFDVSGFADIAVGCGVLMGIKLAASFSRPLTRGRSLTDFWRRWQMTVMGWFRDYVYAPLRGDGASPQRAWIALAVSFFASAAWARAPPGLVRLGPADGRRSHPGPADRSARWQRRGAGLGPRRVVCREGRE